MICASCQLEMEPAARVGAIAVCAKCGASVVVQQDGTVRRATAMDTDALQPGDRAVLVKARSAIARPERRH